MRNPKYKHEKVGEKLGGIKTHAFNTHLRFIFVFLCLLKRLVENGDPRGMSSSSKEH